MEFAHIYELHKLLNGRRYPVPLVDILQRLECSKSTFHRIREVMVDYLGAPIVNQRGRGYFYDLEPGEHFELPGLWFSGKEIVSLALLQQLSETLQPEVVKSLLQPVSDRLDRLLAKQNITGYDWQNRIKVAAQWQRICEPEFFINISHALLQRQQLTIDYWQWQSDMIEKRAISPQRLIYYRDNWYLDAWCHKREALRTFSLDAIKQTNRINAPAIDIEPQQLDEHVNPGYGIFAGPVKGMAQLKFSKRIAKRISRESWHPQQSTEWTSENELLLTIPYSDTRELLRDILHYGSDVEVIAPETLRQEVIHEVENTLKKYF